MTYHLERGQVFFPPDISSIFWSKCRYSIIKVHDSVYKWIHHCMKSTQTTRWKLYPKPPCESHQGMVHHMKGRYLVPLLFKNEEVLKNTVSMNFNWVKSYTVKLYGITYTVRTVSKNSMCFDIQKTQHTRIIRSLRGETE